MKANIHPKFGPCEIQCACGSIFQTRSTKNLLKIEVCNVCHPFWTGKHKVLDTAGRIERFNRKYGTKAVAAASDTAKAVTTASE